MASIPFDQRDGFIWLDGVMTPWADARLHVLSHGLHYASAVFEGERVYNGVIFKLEEHSARLLHSASLMGFVLPWSIEEVNAATREVVARQRIKDGYVRPIAWRGSEMMAISAQHATIHVAIAAWPWPSYFTPQARLSGIRLTVADWRRPPAAAAPVASKAAGLYMICTLSKHAAEAKGFDDALMLDCEGRIAEATGANFFLVMDGALHTPEADAFLNGITRRTVMSLAARLGLVVHERAIMPRELKEAQEAFLTGTAVEITPVRAVDDATFSVGPVTRKLMDAFDSYVRESCTATGRRARPPG